MKKFIFVVNTIAVIIIAVIGIHIFNVFQNINAELEKCYTTSECPNPK